MKRATAVIVGVVSAMLCTAGWAQTQTRQTPIYHCGPQGKELRNTPCPDQPNAPASAVSYDTPSAADTAQARARTQAEQAAAEQADRERLAEEDRQRRNAAASRPQAQPASAASATQIVVLKPVRRRPPKPPHRSASNAVR